MSRVYTTPVLTIALCFGLPAPPMPQLGNSAICAAGVSPITRTYRRIVPSTRRLRAGPMFSSKDAKSQFMKDPGANLTKAEFFYKSEHKG